MAARVRVALIPWEARIRRCGATRFSADQLEWSAPDTLKPFARQPLRTAFWYSLSRAYEFVIWAPDHRFGIDPDIYQGWSSDDADLEYDAENVPTLVDARDSTWDYVPFGGFVCDVKWLDDRHALVIGDNPDAVLGRDSWRPVVDLVDLGKRKWRRAIGPAIEPKNMERYRAERDTIMTRRIRARVRRWERLHP